MLLEIDASKKHKIGKNSIVQFIENYGLIFVALLFFIIFTIIKPQYINPRNIFTMIRQASAIGFMALGLTSLSIVGEIDISFAANATVCGVVSIVLIQNGVNNTYLIWAICILLGMTISYFNARLIVGLGVPSLAGSLGMMVLLTGVARWLTKGIPIYTEVFPAGFDFIGRFKLFGIIPFQTLIFVVIVIILTIFLDFTPQGRYIYSSGGNPEAAYHVGINVGKCKYMAFLIAGFCNGLTGITLSSEYGSASHTLAEGYFFLVLASGFLGATFMTGGVPNPRGTAVATLLLAILNNGLIIVGLPFYVRLIFQGFLVIISIVLPIFINWRKGREFVWFIH